MGRQRTGLCLSATRPPAARRPLPPLSLRSAGRIAMAANFNLALRLKYEQTCPDCGESDFVEDHAAGDLICRDGQGVDPNRVGGPVNDLLSDGGMSTMIGGAKGVDRGLVHNLQRMQARTEVAGDRALISAFKEISAICNAMKLNDTVRHQANEYYKAAHERSKLIKNKPQAAVFAAIIFLACRQTGNPRSFKEICKVVVNASKKDIGKVYKAIVADLRLKESGTFNSEVAAVHPENYIRRFMSHLAMSQADMRNGVALANALMPQQGPEADVHTGWHGKSPMSIAGCIIYIVAYLPRPKGASSVTLSDISAECGVAEQTIRQIYREIHPHLGTLIAKAGGFATAAEIAQLPVPQGFSIAYVPATVQLQQPVAVQQQQLQQPVAVQQQQQLQQPVAVQQQQQLQQPVAVRQQQQLQQLVAVQQQQQPLPR
eukprot:scaffold20.g7621.t1